MPGATGEPRPRATEIRGARMHNLQDVDCSIPLGKITAITGVSGSGKSTLAFDILYAEGQRRFVECLSAYARQFMERLDRPEAEHIGYIQPPIALKQRVSIKNARSTVGSITELSDYLRLLFTHGSELSCLHCGGTVTRTGIEEALEAVRAWGEATPLALVAPLTPKPSAQEAARLKAQGFGRLLADDEIIELDQPEAETNARLRKAGAVGLVIDRVIAGKTRRSRIAEAVETAWNYGDGTCVIHPLAAATPRDALLRTLRGGLTCTRCGKPASEPTPALFSWNSPLGACPTCQGFGRVVTIDRDKVVPDPRRNLRNHAIVPFSVPSARGWYRRMLKTAAERGIPTDEPFAKLESEHQDWVFAGGGRFPGVAGFFKMLERKRYKMHVRIFIARFRGYVPCPTCGGSRLQPAALAASFGGKNIHELHEMPVGDVRGFLDGVTLSERTRQRVRPILESIRIRLACLEDVGVGYLTLARTGRTLSSGETQRIRIAAALGNTLTETLFLLDEPTVGLHAADTARMLAVMKRMAAMGNTVVVVEHDPGIIAGADHLIVLGPGGGRQGGRLIYEGPVPPFLEQNPDYFAARMPPAIAPQAVLRRRSARAGPPRARAARLKHPWSVEAYSRWMAERSAGGTGAPGWPGEAPGTPAGEAPRAAAGKGPAAPRPAGLALTLIGASEHNLRIPRLQIPLNGLVVLTGVSGSGKSTLLDEIIYRNWLRQQGRAVEAVGRVEQIGGWKPVTEMHLIGQELLGRSSRSNPLSFVKAYAEIRKLLAGTLAARQRRLAPGAFSFNTAGGRCESCRGMGTQTLEMYFLPDVEVVCEACEGRRFQPKVLEVTWRGRNIAAILDLTVDEATEFFAGEATVVQRLSPLREVGLGYILLGQSTTTLSGGEAQRLKIASLLAAGMSEERQLFLFDEPTTGLHARDVSRLLASLRALIARGHGVIAVEHQLDFIQAADWVIDLGPGPGPEGGRVVYAGPVAGLLAEGRSPTAQALRARLAETGA
jgi:excinuclease ABC subunit A